MTFRTMAVGVVGFSTLVLVAGCSTEVPADGEVEATLSEAPVQPKDLNLDCTGTTSATHTTATKLIKYAFGAPYTFPAGAACGQVKSALDDMRAGIADGSIIINHSEMMICGVITGTLHVTALGPRLNSIIAKIDSNTDPCFGKGVLAFLMPAAQDGWFAGYMYMDPEPATLTAELTSTQGAAAAAYYSLSLEPTVAKKWNATYGACGTAVTAGEPCSTTALNIGQYATRMIQKNGTLCRCL